MVSMPSCICTNCVLTVYSPGYLFWNDDYRGGDQPNAPTQIPASSVELDDFSSFVRPETTFPFQSQKPNELHLLEKQFQDELDSDPVLAASLRMSHQPMALSHHPKIEDDMSGNDFRGQSEPIRYSGLKPVENDLSDDLAVFPPEPSANPDRRLIPVPDDHEINEHTFSGKDTGFRPFSQTTGGNTCLSVPRPETDTTIQCLSAPGRFGSMSSPIDYTRPQRPSSEGSAMVVDEQKPPQFSFPVQQNVVMEPSVGISGRHYSASIQNRDDEEVLQTACMAVMKSQQEAVHQQSLIQPTEQAQYGPRPHLKVVSQPQHEQTVLYRSDSAARGVLKDREGKGFPAVMVRSCVPISHIACSCLIARCLPLVMRLPGKS